MKCDKMDGAGKVGNKNTRFLKGLGKQFWDALAFNENLNWLTIFYSG